nr:MAG TPA: hypothetical protein [Siphoviridae sp. ctJbC4]
MAGRGSLGGTRRAWRGVKHRALRQRGGRQSGGEKARRTTGDLVAAAETGRFYGAHRGRGSVRGRCRRR